jgi:hypothetical protein
MERIDSKPGRLVDFDAELERLRKAHSAFNAELVVCFLGLSGVGKSTLINALVDGRRSTLPHGGIGPLTAQALSVRRGSPPKFEVVYHSPGQIWKLITALEWGFRDELNQGGLAEPTGSVREVAVEDPLTPDEREELGEVTESKEIQDRSQVESYRKQAQLLVRGGQDVSGTIAYLIDSLRAAVGKPPRRGVECVDEDAGRIRKLKEALAAGRYECHGTVTEERFRAELQDHASGFLAPLIKEMRVTCDSESLPAGVVLVDLPGLGVAGDIHKIVTSQWVREHARCVVLVVSHRGIQEDEAQLLQESGFLNRLIYTAENPADDPVTLMVAMVRGDEIAVSRYMTDRQNGKQVRTRPEYFAEVCDESRQLVYEQLKPQLRRAWSSGQIQEVQIQVIDNLLETLEVHPVSAVEYARAIAHDPYVPSFLGEPGLSNIPGLLNTLMCQAERRRESEIRRLEEVLTDFQSRLDTTLEVIKVQWMEDRRAAAEAERLRDELILFLEPLRGEYRTRQGAFREFLRETLPQTIRAEVAKARAC